MSLLKESRTRKAPDTHFFMYPLAFEPNEQSNLVSPSGNLS
jgi:hypothetical protein